ncbi:M81 family metallopeptidase [Ideonella sp. BN130291]|uniref:M81 family metallopeptidase n=1 Tax=Ideonella sp. BN130291 TaxID=3112940 RepID=UPI002E276E0D|nr:M81 family metallopeptidase [Ideonella sp. BN130291]
MARIGIAGLQHETNTFADSRARFCDFVLADAWPGLLWRGDLPAGLQGTQLPAAGMLQALQAAGHEAVPLLWGNANPSGPVTEDAFEALWWLFERALAEAGPLDALLLELHGAMVTEHLPSGDSEWLRRTRERVGERLPIVAVLDFHANLTPAMADQLDLALVYRTYPHTDTAQCGREAVHQLAPLLAGARYARALRQLPFLIPLPWQSTLASPMRELMAQAVAASGGEVVHVSLAGGFPMADVPDSAPSVLVYAHDQAAADRAADTLTQAVQAARSQFGGRLWPPGDAVAHALAVGRPGAPVVLADTQDNPGGGGDGDSTGVLQALLQARAAGACLGLLCDPEAAAAAHAAGVGAWISVALGGKRGRHSGEPVAGPWRVEALGDGRILGTGPFYGGSQMALGAMARLSQHGVQVLVSSRKQQAADQAMFRHLGIEPAQCALLALKSSVHFRADFGPLAAEVLVVESEGANIADLHRLHYRHCTRPPA